jgi:hypothetical protein
MIPTAQPNSFPTLSPIATIYQTRGVVFFPGSTVYNRETDNNKDELLGLSYILFGRNVHVTEGGFPFVVTVEKSSTTNGFVSLVNDGICGISRDSITQSTTVLGDINNDGFLEFMIGLPIESKCLVYLGASGGYATTESFTIVGDLEEGGGGQIGWASTRIGDLNRDRFDEIIVSAPYANIVYVIYGRQQFPEDIVVTELNSRDGLKLIGSNQDTYFGVALSAVHDFNKDGLQDIAVTAVRPSGENVIYLILSISSCVQYDIHIDQLSSTSCFRIFAPYLSYAGFSISGIGDINNGGYNDLAIGSIPVDNARYVEQRTFIVYGRGINWLSGLNDLYLSQMTRKDGFIVIGAGFLVQAAGDVNGDGIPDVMLTSYYDWEEKGNTYLINYPVNVTYSPTFLPSSLPSSQPSSLPSAAPSSTFPSASPSASQTTFYPSSGNSSQTLNPQIALTRSPTLPSTLKPSGMPSFRPSHTSNPTFSPTLLPSRKPTPVPTSLRVLPSAQPVTQLPTIPHFLRSRIPTTLPTVEVTLNTTDFTVIDCKQRGSYFGHNQTNYKFIINANSGTVSITGVEYGGLKNLYILSSCPSDRVDLVITNFRLSTDIISVAHLQTSGYSYPSLNEIPFVVRDGVAQPVTLLFCSEGRLQVILSSHRSFGLTERNFLFVPPVTDEPTIVKGSGLVQAQIAIVFAVFGFLFLIFSALAYQNRKDEEERMKHEQQWLLLPETAKYVENAKEEEVEDVKIDQVIQDGCKSPDTPDNKNSLNNDVLPSFQASSSSSSSGSQDESSETVSSSIKTTTNGSDYNNNYDRSEAPVVPAADNEQPAQQAVSSPLPFLFPVVFNNTDNRLTELVTIHTLTDDKPTQKQSNFETVPGETTDYLRPLFQSLSHSSISSFSDEESDNEVGRNAATDELLSSINTDNWLEALDLSDDDSEAQQDEQLFVCTPASSSDQEEVKVPEVFPGMLDNTNTPVDKFETYSLNSDDSVFNEESD